MKTCPRCGVAKPLHAFTRNRRRSDSVQSYCAMCHREYLRLHYERNAAKYRASAKARNQRRRDVLRQIIREAKDRPCADCGAPYPPYVMDFDHRTRGNKRFNIGRDALGRYSEEALRVEIAKCDVVCANCHRKRTHSLRAERRGEQ